ncbi:MAG TPA: 50S ribosomal protein L9 [Microthrixaceae bacterium]|nr:50S ribosomal protein L9 [Microthrixaceae bacterium]
MSVNLKVLLRGDVDGLGKKGDIVEVTTGYARNFLLPRGLALKATTGAEAQAGAMRRKRILKDAKDREASEEIAKLLVPKVINLSARAGEGGKLFGSITQNEIVAAIEEQSGVVLERRTVLLDEHIKTTGTHTVQVRLHSEVEFPVTLEVAAS